MVTSGLGGYGAGGHNSGVFVDLNVNGPLNFINVVGGSGGSFNYGVEFATPVTVVSGGINFSNVVGGSGGTNEHGVYVPFAVTSTSIIATDCYGGQGTGTDIGFYITTGGSLGSSITNQISITAGSLGTGSNEVGIQVDGSGQIVVNDGGTITLNGSGGGLYNGAGANNHGVTLSGAILTAGNGGSSATTINISGIGGHGRGSTISTIAESI